MAKLSIIIPCYNEEESFPILYSELCRVAEEMEASYGLGFEFLCIDDGSKDHTLAVIKDFSKEDSRIQYLSFSRNFGKEAAIYAGLQNCTGDYVALIDADMQDPPSLLPQMYAAVSSKGPETYDCVATRRVTRQGEPPIRSFFARQFYKIINKISDVDIVDGARDFRLMTRKMANAILSMKEYNRFSKGIFGWVGFKTKWLPYENIERVAGETKWSFWKLFLYSLEGIVAFSSVPLAIASIFGFILCLVAIIFIVIIIVKTLAFGDPVSGWPSLACLILFMGGIQLLSTGILGQYLSKTYLETKRRPIYLIGDSNLAEQEG